MTPWIQRQLRWAAMTFVVVLMVSGCGSRLGGKTDSFDPAVVAGMRVTEGPSGLRAGAPKPARTAKGTDGGSVDVLAAQAVSDVEDYWKGAWGDAFPGTFSPVQQLISWDSEARGGSFCGSGTAGLVNAAFCSADSSIGWDRGVLLPGLRTAYGDMAVTMVLAHEYGHAVQHQARLNSPNTSVLVAEQQADCFAGAYMRWVAEGKSRRFTLSTGSGLNNQLAGMLSFRDPLLTGKRTPAGGGGEHGSAFERISAFQFGFADGPSECKRIDAAEVKGRRGDLPVALQRGQSGEWPVSGESVKSVVAALTILFKPADPPALSFNVASAAKCPDARPTPPVSFCPASNIIAVDLPGLKKLGAPRGGNGLSGDNTAYSVLISRYMLALQHAQGLPLDSPEAGLRTACLTGVATAKLARQVSTPDGNTVALTAGDLDEAVAGLLTNGLAASDVNGKSVPAGFARIDAFRAGVLGDVQLCLALHV
ncbi:neutral zinc metallopeptidase [Mycolicibacterium peregrinum]|uniref:Peptidase n=1 Tax=Mycolicibacterium peregrinum TaxID=43304 RepID=A0A1A0VN76_MYCPR|nr:peptidase [Mycolicibacterium peregrinum]